MDVMEIKKMPWKYQQEELRIQTGSRFHNFPNIHKADKTVEIETRN